MKKNGKRDKIQRYKCVSCGHRFTNTKRTSRASAQLWREYAHGKQTLEELSDATGRSHIWVRKQLDAYTVSKESDVTPQKTVIVPDTTFWGKHYGVTVFRAWTIKKNIWWDEVDGERMATYHYGRKICESKGWIFTAAVIDGRRGLAAVFKDMPVQTCHFHQEKTVSKYLTRRPDTEAG